MDPATSKKPGVMIVTGGSRGIGAAICILAARKGFDVCINYSSSAEHASKVAEVVQQHGQRALAYKADLSSEAEIVQMFAAVDQELGPVTALVNNGGISGQVGRVDEMSSADLQNIFAINVIGSFLCSREAVRRMSSRHGGHGGSIINISSAAARLGAAGRNIHYAASKRAVEALAFGLAQEVASEGIRVNAVSPGVIATDIHDPARLAAMAPQLPMGRAGTAEEVANTVLWLASDHASYVSGTVVGVSGAR